jgi:hypothetical protein
MKLEFMQKYLPVSQEDVVDGSRDLEEGSRRSSLKCESREKVLTLATQPSKLSVFKQWLPWLLCVGLTISNMRLGTKLKGLVFDDAVYCKLFTHIDTGPNSLKVSAQRRSTSPHMDGRI